MRAVTLKAAAGGAAQLVAYYQGLARDQLHGDGAARGPVDYYLDPDEPPGRWWGSGRREVGLEGDVRPEQLWALLEGRHPITGEVLGRRFGDSSARAFDATFSAAKSVSVLWALADDPRVRAEVTAAHDTAVEAALGWLERHGAVTRRGHDGVDQVDTRGLVVGLFRQHTSRTADPQLHTHAVIWSKVQDPTGRWLALDARFLKYQQRSIGWVYDAALRAELTARLGVTWGPVIDGHADIAGIPDVLLAEFSRRSTQVDEKLRELITRWIDEHDGADPDPRTIARLERKAVLASRPGKHGGLHAELLRAEWRQRAAALGFEALSVPSTARRLLGMDRVDWEAVIATAIHRVSQHGATWLQADLAREIATLFPVDGAASAGQLVEVVDELAAEAADRCVELHPPARGPIAVRVDGRPVSEHITNRRLTSQATLDEETALLAWARRNAGVARTATWEDPQAAAARAVAGTHRLVLVVGPAGTGKTTMLRSGIAQLRARQRPVVGLAPSGKAADVLARETGCRAATLASFLQRHTNPARASISPPPGTTIVLDEAGMAATGDLARLVHLADTRFWRLVCIGDPDQLPAVGRGGMFAQWCDSLPAHRLDHVHRFAEPWQAAASLQLRRGDPAAAEAYAARQRLETIHPALLPARVARLQEAVERRGESLAITCASKAPARAINVEIQRCRDPHRSGPTVELADGTQALVGDRVATRRNALLVTDSGSVVRNRHTWTVTAVGRDGSITVTDPDRGTVILPAGYVTRHVELGWAVTGYGSQAITTDHGICIVEAGSGRAGMYVGMTRGRRHNRALIVDPTGLGDPEDAFAAAIARPATALTAHALRDQLFRSAGVDPPGIELTKERGHRALVPAPGRSSPARGLGL
jgi:conjugative relaxase-like TrwC/TraI family protein